jgi:hypothetical protein
VKTFGRAAEAPEFDHPEKHLQRSSSTMISSSDVATMRLCRLVP